MKKDFIELIFILLLLICMIFSNNEVTQVISAIFMLVYILSSKLKNNINKNKILKSIKNYKKDYMIYKENNTLYILCALTFCINALNNIQNIIHNKNMNLFFNNDKEIEGILDFISRSNPEELTNVFVYSVLMIIGIIMFIEYIVSVAIISDDKIIFYNGNIFEFSQILSIKYKTPFFLSDKKKIVKFYKGSMEKEIIIHIKDFDRLKSYLDEKIPV